MLVSPTRGQLVFAKSKSSAIKAFRGGGGEKNLRGGAALTWRPDGGAGFPGQEKLAQLAEAGVAAEIEAERKERNGSTPKEAAVE
eukprot:7443371-Pyramimonas_sp.AAC.1